MSNDDFALVGLRCCIYCNEHAFDNEVYCSACGKKLPPADCRCKYCDNVISTTVTDGR